MHHHTRLPTHCRDELFCYVNDYLATYRHEPGVIGNHAARVENPYFCGDRPPSGGRHLHHNLTIRMLRSPEY